MNFNKLKGKMAEMEFTQEKLANKLDITLQSFNSKINERSQFTLKEIIGIISALQMNSCEVIEIFFKDCIPNVQRYLKE